MALTQDETKKLAQELLDTLKAVTSDLDAEPPRFAEHEPDCKMTFCPVDECPCTVGRDRRINKLINRAEKALK